MHILATVVDQLCLLLETVISRFQHVQLTPVHMAAALVALIGLSQCWNYGKKHGS